MSEDIKYVQLTPTPDELEFAELRQRLKACMDALLVDYNMEIAYALAEQDAALLQGVGQRPATGVLGGRKHEATIMGFPVREVEYLPTKGAMIFVSECTCRSAYAKETGQLLWRSACRLHYRPEYRAPGVTVVSWTEEREDE